MKALYEVKAAAQALAIRSWTVSGYILDGKLRPVRLERFLSQAQAQNGSELERFVESHGPVVKIQKEEE